MIQALPEVQQKDCNMAGWLPGLAVGLSSTQFGTKSYHYCLEVATCNVKRLLGNTNSHTAITELIPYLGLCEVGKRKVVVLRREFAIFTSPTSAIQGSGWEDLRLWVLPWQGKQSRF